MLKFSYRTVRCGVGLAGTLCEFMYFTVPGNLPGNRVKCRGTGRRRPTRRAVCHHILEILPLLDRRHRVTRKFFFELSNIVEFWLIY